MWRYVRAGISMFNSEVKMFDTDVSHNADYNGYTQGLMTQVQGTAYNQHEGNSVRFIGFELNLAFVLAATAEGRIALVIDNECNGATPALGDSFEVGSIGAINTAAHAPYSHLNPKRWNFLLDFNFVNPQGVANVMREVRKVVPYTGHMDYIGVTAAIASCGNGTPFLQIVGNSATATDVVMRGVVRCFYVDN